jgi:hypothetical protein
MQSRESHDESSPTQMNTTAASHIWWGHYKVPDQHGGCWRIGPLTLWIQRFAREWRIAYVRSSDPMASEVEKTVPAPAETIEPAIDASLSRYSFRQTHRELELVPLLADRSVVSRPETPFYIPAGEELTLYISSPLWVRVMVGEPPTMLQELPIYRPSDTWFGPSTREGELCYASRTHCRLRLEDVPFRPHRAVTPVLIRNRGERELHLERLSLPVPYLSLYRDADGRLWTEPVTLDHEPNAEMASMKLGQGPAPEAKKAKEVSGPRRRAEANLLVRAFSALFG